MDEILKLLWEHRDVAFATVEANEPHLRVFQLMMMEGTTLYFATSRRKAVYNQLLYNAHVALLSLFENRSIMITGTVSFEVPDEVAQEIYKENAILMELYAKYSDLVYLKVPIEHLSYYDLNQVPPIVRDFQLE